MKLCELSSLNPANKLNLEANDQSESSPRVKITLNGIEAAQEYTMD